MTTLTILKDSIKDDLIIISRKELARLLALSKNDKRSVRQIAFEAKAHKDIVGPFSNTKDLFKSLNL